MILQVVQGCISYVNVTGLIDGVVASTGYSVSTVAQTTLGAGVLTVGAGASYFYKNHLERARTEDQVLQDLQLNIGEIPESQHYVVHWCKEACSNKEYNNRIFAAKKILNCYAQEEQSLDLRNLGLTTLPQLNLPSLWEFSLANNQLKELPNGLNLPSLERLSLANNQLKELPNGLNLPSLQRLYLENNQLKDLPNELNLPSLQELYLQNNQLKELPNGLNLPSLQELHLENNQLKELPNGLNLPSLRRLYLNNNQLKELPNGLNLPSLQELHLENNQLEDLPNGLNLPSLQRLYLNNNQLKELPNGLNLPSLQELHLENNQLEDLPNGLNLPSLQRLYLNNNQLKELPNGLNLPSLQQLYLNNNQLKELPNELNLPSLQWLSLDNNQLKELPNELNLPSLQWLSLDNNQLKELPNGLNLPSLQELFLANNQLKELPNGLNLPSLRLLSLRNNSISEFSVDQPLFLPRLLRRYLQGSYNQLRELPLSLAQCSQLTEIHIEGTHIEPSQVDRILAACQNLRNQGAVEALPHLLKLWSGYAKSDVELLQFISDFSDEEKIHMHEWLIRLSRTRDFKSDQQELAKIVCAMLEDLTNESFKELFMSQISANNEACQDRSAMALNELYVSWKILVPKEEQDLPTVLAGAGKTLALRKILSKIPQMAGQGEGVEIYLYYETHLRERLGLLTAIQSMAYDSIGRRDWINEDLLVQEIEGRYLEEVVSLPIFDQLFSKDQAAKEKCETIQTRFGEELDELEKKYEQEDITEWDYKAGCDQCMLNLEQALNQFKQEWFLSKLSSGSASN